MKQLAGFLLAVSVASFWCATPVQSEEPFFDFVRALRERGYSDTALEYLDELETRSDLPPAIKQELPFERAQTLQSAGENTKIPQERNRLLDRALAELEKFVQQAGPDHPLAAQANSELGRIYIGKAKVELIQADSPANQSDRGNYQAEARKFIEQAKKIFQTARDQHEKSFNAFPVFIPKENAKDLEARSRAEVDFMRSQLELAKANYEEAQTWDRGSKEFQAKLLETADMFEKLHTRYRSQVVGLYARLWQAKSYEELERIGVALGFYNELLSHPGTSQTLLILQDQTLQFRLICLNHPQRNDFQLVVQEANEWLAKRGKQASPIIRQGIMWEKARALESLGQNVELPDGLLDFIDLAYMLTGSKTRAPRGDQETFFSDALEQANFLALTTGQYQEPARAMAQRLEVSLNRLSGDPQEFSIAASIGSSLIKRVKRESDNLKAAKTPEEKAEATNQLKAAADRGIRVLRIALKLATPANDGDLINKARYELAYLHYLKRENERAAVLAGFVGERAPRESAMAMDAAYLAMACYVQAYNDLKTDNEYELSQIIRYGELITRNWPESDRANESRLRLGDIYREKNDPVEAANWYVKVPANSAKYIDAQLAAGQSFLAAYFVKAVEEGVDPKTLEEWQAKAREYLVRGIQLQEAQLTAESKPPEELMKAKLSLVQIMVMQAEYANALKTLREGSHAIIPAVTVPDNAQRPEEGFQSRPIASLSYQMLLRTYVGLEQIDQALQAMEELEKIASAGNNPDELLQIYEDLGRELQKEMERLKTLGQTERLVNLRQSFDTFLTRLFERRSELKYSSLVWIGQTYSSLGEGTLGGDNPTDQDKKDAAKYFKNAADTYANILVLVESKPDTAEPEQVTAVKILRAQALRRAFEYQQAFDLIVELLKQNANSLSGQREAAYILQDWAATHEGESYKMFIDAIGNGPMQRDKGLPVWGWRKVGITWDQLIRRGENSPQNKDRLYESMYNHSWCLNEYAKSVSGNQRSSKLEEARLTLSSYARGTSELPDEWYKKWNTLYGDIQQSLGVTVEALPRHEPGKLVNVSELPKEVVEAKPATQQPLKTPQRSSESSRGWLLAVVVMVVGLAAAGGLLWYMVKNGRRRPSYASSGAKKTAPAATKPTAKKPPATKQPPTPPTKRPTQKKS